MRTDPCCFTIFTSDYKPSNYLLLTYPFCTTFLWFLRVGHTQEIYSKKFVFIFGHHFSSTKSSHHSENWLVSEPDNILLSSCLEFMKSGNVDLMIK